MQFGNRLIDYMGHIPFVSFQRRPEQDPKSESSGLQTHSEI